MCTEIYSGIDYSGLSIRLNYVQIFGVVVSIKNQCLSIGNWNENVLYVMQWMALELYTRQDARKKENVIEKENRRIK